MRPSQFSANVDEIQISTDIQSSQLSFKRDELSLLTPAPPTTDPLSGDLQRLDKMGTMPRYPL